MLTERAMPPLRSAVLVTLGALVIYRLGQTVPLPGLSLRAVADVIGGGTAGLPRLSVMALGLTPLLSVLLLVEMLRYLVPPFARWYDPRRQRLRWWVVALALAMAMVQAVGIANALEQIRPLVPEPGLAFRLAVVASLLAGAAALIWLADEVTRRGLTDGFWLLLAVPTLAELPQLLSATRLLVVQGALDFKAAIAAIAYLLVSAMLIIALERARHPDAGGERIAGLWPPILAASVAGWLSALGLALVGSDPHAFAGAWYGPRGAGFMIAMAALIVLFSVLRLLRKRLPSPTDRAGLIRAGALAGTIQAAICVVGALLSLVDPMAIPGIWLIVVVTVAVRVRDRVRGPAT